MNDMFAHVTVRISREGIPRSLPGRGKSGLVASSELLNQKMREIRDSGKVVGLDRVAVMAALNLANELLKTQGQDQELKRHRGLAHPALCASRLDSALGPAKQLTL